MVSRHKAEFLIGTVEKTFNEQGYKAAQEQAERLFFDRGLNLTTAERRRFVGLAMGRVHGIGAERTARLKIVREHAKILSDSYNNNVTVDEEHADQVLQELADLGDTRSFFRVSRDRSRARTMREYSKLNDREQTEELTRNLGAVPNSVIGRIVSAESAGRADARNANSSALGAGQFIDETWLRVIKQYRPDLTEGRTKNQILALRGNKALSVQMTQRYAQENISHLEAANVPVNDATIYLSHFLGPGAKGGAVGVLRADPSTPIEKLVSKGKIDANEFLRGMTAGDVIQWAAGKMGGGGVPRPDQSPNGIWTAKRNGLDFYKASELFGSSRNSWLDATTAHYIDELGESVFKDVGIRLEPTVLRGSDDDQRSGVIGFDVSALSDDQRQSVLRTAIKMGFTAVGFGDDGSLQLGTGQARTFGNTPEWAGNIIAQEFNPNRETLNGLRLRCDHRPTRH